MKTYDNFGRPSTEMHTLIKQDGTVVITNTVCYNGEPSFQTVTTRTVDGRVNTDIVRGGKVLP